MYMYSTYCGTYETLYNTVRYDTVLDLHVTQIRVGPQPGDPKWLLKTPFPIYVYCNFPKFSDRQVWANSALFAIPSASFGPITLW